MPNPTLTLIGHVTTDRITGALVIDGRPLGQVVAAAFGSSPDENRGVDHLGTLQVTVEKL